MRIRVIGVGGPWGEDRLGWRVADALRAQPLPGRPEVVARDRPGLALLDDLSGLDAVVLVDAMRGGGPPGAVRILDGDDLARGPRLSTHDLGVGAALALAEALAHPLPAIRLVGIEAQGLRCGASSPSLDRAVGDACAAVGRALRELCRELRGAGGGAPRGTRRALSSRMGELL